MKNGFSLVETVIIIGISTVAFIALVNLFLVFNSLYGYQRALMGTAGSASTSMNALEASVLPADQVLASHTFSGTTHSSATTTLVLELPTVDSSGNLVGTSKDYVVVYASSTTLYLLTESAAGSTRVSGRTQLTTMLNSVSFTYDHSDFTKVTNVIADVQTQTQYKTQTLHNHLRERLYLRNLP